MELINFLADDALGLAFAAGQGANGEDVALGEETEAFAEVFGHRVAGHARLGLDVDRHVRHAVVFLEDNLELVLHARNLHERLFDLTRIEIDALDDQHVVRAPRDAVDPEPRAAARAPFAADDARDVVRAVADDRHRLAGERREHHFAVLAVGHVLARRGVDDFGDVVVVPHVDARMRGAVLARRADAARLRHAVDVEALDVEAVLDLLAHFVGEGLAAEHAHAQRRDVVVAGGIRIELLDDARHIAHDGAEALHAEVAHELDLALGVAA